jgi:hypothetical protein
MAEASIDLAIAELIVPYVSQHYSILAIIASSRS